MKHKWFSVLACVAVVGAGISANAGDTQQAAVDHSFEEVRVAVSAASLAEILQIDHARLAAAEGVEMPPARVQLFSDPALNAAILRENIRAGLDLPFRVLSFEEKGTPTVSYTSSAFLAQRHNLSASAPLADFDARLHDVFSQVKEVSAQKVATDDIVPDFAILEIRSNYGVEETVSRLKKVVTAQSDTIWFGEIDFQAEAEDYDVSLVPAQLLLFGGPAPGGVAMAAFPAIGLDAFCQKLLVYQGRDGKAVVIYNDIAALAQLHYGQSIEPHDLLNKRLTATFAEAVK
ncbi:uncharacterized protein (DUF302 family) [Pelagimonas varians]|uniref:DUF302 domain-containing protein n=2 Tax=Pelagimonas varians TaxID=696760 RepID=A0A238KSN6_9RHOB|nr:DUF302 domain-containing protein [Pelagimonas varians]PYG32540.1 uncharacterized protein (DUF302 family) [Pelagimonas varians]SMX45864.1 hypothetical protein PEV8663_03133 [Pelagimonas varians]